MFLRVSAFRFWAAGFYLLTAASACLMLHAKWHHDVLLLATATLALQSRILIWSGTRQLFGAAPWWRTGFAVTAVFFTLCGTALVLNAPMLIRALLLALFFAPCRAATLYEVIRRRRPQLRPARLMVAVGSGIAVLNAIVPVILMLVDRTNLALLPGDGHPASAFYAVVFAADLLLTCGLIALAFKLMIVEREMLATLDRGALAQLAQLAQSRDVRVSRAAPQPHTDAWRHDTSARPHSLPDMV
ncbi:MAG TPA: hypothetical protein VFE79_26575 [Paraburkholderia sp.]|nr:hypothetical protein [Paraburkholderia sp.]